MAPDEWTTEVAKLYRMRSAGKTDRRSLAGSILFISGQDGGGRAPGPAAPRGRRRVFFFFFRYSTGGKGILRRGRPLIRLVFFPVATHIDGYRRNDNDAFNNILHIGIDADKGKTAFDQAKDHRANQGAGNAPHSAH